MGIIKGIEIVEVIMNKRLYIFYSANVVPNGKVWPDELTDAAVEIFESEKNNREQRRKRREERERKDRVD